MPVAQLKDVNLYYEIHGEGFPLILIAGFTADRTVWETILSDLAKHYQVIAFDNRGVGQSGCPDYPYTVDMMANDVVHLCKHLGITQAYFMGNSMGGAIAQTLCYHYPQLVKAAVLECTFSKISINFSINIDGQLALRENGVSSESMLKIGLPWAFSDNYLNQDGILDELITVAKQMPYPMTLDGFRHQWHACKMFDSSTWLSEISTSCLILAGDRDVLVPQWDQHDFVKQITNADYFCFEGVGHLPHVEAPRKYVSQVTEYLKRYN